MSTPTPQPERITPAEVRELFHDMIHILTEQNLVILTLNGSMSEVKSQMQSLNTRIEAMARIILKDRGIDPDTFQRLDDQSDNL
jgi:uncharacterized Fe-S cluster-containing radical SAM superfamily protein